jgi:hypothetical protein
MKRREFIAASAALLVPPRRSWAQGTPRRIGFLGAWADEPARDPVHAAWLSGLREKGWIEGKNLLVEYRYAPDRLPALAAELVALTPDVLIAVAPQAAVALKSATATIPIVFVAVADPLGLGLVQSLSRPGGNITGLATVVPDDFFGKRLEILHELVPGASKIALLVNPNNPIQMLNLRDFISHTARRLGVALLTVEATKAEELDVAFASAAAQHADAINWLQKRIGLNVSTFVVPMPCEVSGGAQLRERQVLDRGLRQHSASAYLRVGTRMKPRSPVNFDPATIDQTSPTAQAGLREFRCRGIIRERHPAPVQRLHMDRPEHLRRLVAFVRRQLERSSPALSPTLFVLGFGKDFSVLRADLAASASVIARSQRVNVVSVRR